MMEPSFELPIKLPPRGSRELVRTLHRQLKSAIIEGRLQPGLRLPASRSLACLLGVSRNTVLAAYDLLLAEGYVSARAGAGTRVIDVRVHATPPASAVRSKASPSRRSAHRMVNAFYRRGPGWPIAPVSRTPRFDLRLGQPDQSLLPFDVWNRLSARALRAQAGITAVYGPPQGEPALREAIASYVSFARAVSCRSEDIIVTAGAQQAFDLLARVLVVPGRTLAAVEHPGYLPVRAAFAAQGANVVGIPVDAEGLIVERLPSKTRVVYVTPSHQFPLGMAMSARRRAELLEFARASGVCVIEDDYDGEFRFGGQPLDALQTLDRSGSVFYVGTFSKSLFPALRIGFLVAPDWARPALVAAKLLADRCTPAPPQVTLAAFITEGHLARHVRRMRKVYGARRAALLDALAQHGRGLLEPIPALAGLHVAARIAKDVQVRAVVEHAANLGIGLESLAQYAVGRAAPRGLAFGYGSIREEEIETAITRLARLLRSATSLR